MTLVFHHSFLIGYFVIPHFFLLGLLCLAALGHGYVWIAAINRLHGMAGSKKLIDLATNICLATFLFIPLLVAWQWNDLNIGSARGSFSSGDGLLIYISLCTLWGAVKLALLWLGPRPADHPLTLLSHRQERVKFPEQSNHQQHFGTFSRLLSRIQVNQTLQLCVDRKQLVIPRLHKSHEGLTIAHIGDLHMTGRIGKQWFVSVCQEVNHLQADVVTITGDILENELCWPWLAESLGVLNAKYGVYYVLGNHDKYVDFHHTKKILDTQGLTYIGDDPITTEWNESAVLLAGNELPWIDQVSDLSDAPERNSAGLPLHIFLLHTPDQFTWACQGDADLVLAGHTHGGQVRLPVLGPVACPSLYGTRYACGVFKSGNTVMHVTRGISGKTPLRINCPPEIALLELVRPEDPS